MPSRFAAKLLIVLLATFVALVASEIVLRLVWHNPYRHESPDHLVKLKFHHPRTDHIYRRALGEADDSRLRLRTNERSYILPAARFENPDATVVFFGGSTTECLSVQEKLRFPALVSVLLEKEGLRVNTLNIARAGDNVHDCINVLLNHVVSDRPDVAVLMEASNDVGLLERAGGYEPSMGYPASPSFIAKWLVQLTSSHSYLVALVRESAIPGTSTAKDPSTDWRQTSPPADSTKVDLYRTRLKVFVHVCRDFGIVPVLMTQPYSRHRTPLTPAWLDETSQDQFNGVIREVGASEGVLVIDLATHLRADIPKWDEPNHIFYDAIHLTDQGSQVYAAHIAANLRPLVLELRP